jgi:hypothetical protein
MNSKNTVFIATCGRRQGTARRPLQLHTPAPIRCGPGGERLQLTDPQIDTRFVRTAGSSAMPAAYAATARRFRVTGEAGRDLSSAPMRDAMTN